MSVKYVDQGGACPRPGRSRKYALYEQLCNSSIVTSDNLIRFYTKIGRNYVYQLESMQSLAYLWGLPEEFMNDTLKEFV